jgi:hypothetical protein
MEYPSLNLSRVFVTSCNIDPGGVMNGAPQQMQIAQSYNPGVPGAAPAGGAVPSVMNGQQMMQPHGYGTMPSSGTYTPTQSNMPMMGNAGMGMPMMPAAGGAPGGAPNGMMMNNMGGAQASGAQMGRMNPMVMGQVPVNPQQQQQYQQQQQQQMMQRSANGQQMPPASSSSSSSAGTKRKAWHNMTDDTPIRTQMIERIITLLQQRRPNATSDWQEKLPHMAKRLESELYSLADSRDEYSDPSTLKNRLQQLALSMGNKQQVKPGAPGAPGSSAFPMQQPMMQQPNMPVQNSMNAASMRTAHAAASQYPGQAPGFGYNGGMDSMGQPVRYRSATVHVKHLRIIPPLCC